MTTIYQQHEQVGQAPAPLALAGTCPVCIAGARQWRRSRTSARSRPRPTTAHQPIPQCVRRRRLRGAAAAAPTPPGGRRGSPHRRRRGRWPGETTPGQRGLLALIITIVGALIALAAIPL